MTISWCNEPYQGNIVDLIAAPERADLLKKIAADIPEITLNERQMCDLEMLATGVFSPLKGFMSRADYESVLDRMQLQNGLLWPIPVCLDISEMRAKNLEAGQSLALKDPEGVLLAVLHVADIWQPDMEKEASLLFGTTDRSHPGVYYLMNISRKQYVGGDLEVITLPIHYDFRKLRMKPSEVRAMFKKLGWQRAAGFHTRNPIHRPQFEMTVHAMLKVKANLLILSNAGPSIPRDFDPYTRVRCYREMVRRYPPDSVLLNVLPLAARMAGPRDAVLHAIVSKNFGCTHFIVGHHHATPDNLNNGTPYYKGDAAGSLAVTCGKEIGIDILPIEKMLYLPFEDEYRFNSEVPEGAQTISFTDTDIRKRIRLGRNIPEWVTFPEVMTEIQRSYPPPRKQGFTVFFTGLSGAGKSTLARVLYARFLEIGDRPVTLLDGDIVRHNLSNELTFSKEHRDVNVRRIGFVASEITKNRGIAICAPIAPYAATRQEIRAMIEPYGGFTEVHVSTPIAVCEKRDRKGMYAKARAGMIKGFTGVDDPYESPETPELRIDTSAGAPDECVHEVLLFLGQKGFI